MDAKSRDESIKSNLFTAAWHCLIIVQLDLKDLSRNYTQGLWNRFSQLFSFNAPSQMFEVIVSL